LWFWKHNGDYQRFADKTQRCRKSFDGTVDITTGAFGGFRNLGAVLVWTFPAGFAVTPEVYGTSGNSNALFLNHQASSATTTDLVFWRAASSSAVTVKAALEAIGKWAA
jgi:hypothetical protein